MAKELKVRTCDDRDVPVLLREPSARARATVIMAHGIFSERTERGRFDRQAAMLNDMGLRTLQFDFRGHGSHKLSLPKATIAGMVLDYASVSEFAARKLDEPIYWVSSSFGAAVSLLYCKTTGSVLPQRAYFLNPVVDFVATFVEPQASDMKGLFTAEKWDQSARRGYLEPMPGRRLSRTFLVELCTMQPQAGLSYLRVPVKVLHGSKDRSVPFDVTEKLIAQHANYTFQSLEGADHAFAEAWEEQASFKSIKDWFSQT